MDQQVQRDVRSAISTAYGLMQHTRTQHAGGMARALGGLEDRLRYIEGRLGGPDSELLGPIDLSEEIAEIKAHMSEPVAPLVDQLNALIRDVHRLERRISRLASREIASRSLLGVLPLARVIPQDVHSVVDYASGLTAAAGIFARTPEARVCSALLGASAIGVAATTDYRLSVEKVIPIEAHEVIDYAWGASAIAAPFVLGYHRKDPIAAALHVFTGALSIVTALFTDYRAAAGVGRPGWR
ncbi:SPW repeat domain-containing protein [Chondromyces crocatus]|uniref:SPW repeat-containing integral membrane domain-containing protein n=1 Tax=Chondromyces crocatus TaxID=52 RepID=A0A0K1EDL7_CHOCO|nr:hypothetical protein [Chondromyces crocatus]AKT38970.1 uncharacterized protein CMC5_031170 [Chondromyces crocatus]